MQHGKRPIEVYEDVKLILTARDIKVADYKLIDYGLQFTVSISKWVGTIRIYENKKGILRIDYSQLRGEPNATKVRSLIETGRNLAETHLSNTSKDRELRFPIIGTDESGKGDYFGPLVGAGIYVDEISSKELAACGIMDSKALSDRTNLDLAHRIPRICRGRYAVVEISPAKYNQLYEQFRRENKKLNTLLAWGHAKALEEVLSKVDCAAAVADQFADERFILSKLQEKGKRIQLIQMPKAEQNIAVAAASILARARFLEKLSSLSKKHEINLPKGASQAVIDVAREFVRKHGQDALRQVAKLHFKTTAQVLS